MAACSVPALWSGPSKGGKYRMTDVGILHGVSVVTNATDGQKLRAGRF